MGPTYLKVRNFDRFQHYKNRRPPWIKLYNNLTDDYDFGCLSNASKYLAIGMLLLASRTDNHIPNDPAWIARELHYDGDPDLEEVQRSGFIEVCGCKTCASNSLSSSKHSAPLASDKQSALLEREREKRETTEPNGSGEDAPLPREEQDATTNGEPKALTPQQLDCQYAMNAWNEFVGEDVKISPSLLMRWVKQVDTGGFEDILKDLHQRGKIDELRKEGGKGIIPYIAKVVREEEKVYSKLEQRFEKAGAGERTA